MFGSLLGRKFSNKCKHYVKCIRCRMETIRKKKEAMVRYLKKDVADLISCGHEDNALGRMDALIVEMNQASCYAMIELYCCCIVEHLPTMQKDRVCPEDTVEAVATLIFAAARFPGLPELADLRHLFTRRYGTHMEAYINEEFVEKMQKNTFPKQKKLQLMQDIANEFSVNWDIKAFKYRLSNLSAPAYVQPEKKFPCFNENNKTSQNFVEERQIDDAKRIEIDQERKPVLEKNLHPASRSSKVRSQQAKCEPKNTELLKEDKRFIEKTDMNIAQKHSLPEWDESRTSLNVNGHRLDSARKINKVVADGSDTVGLQQFDAEASRIQTKENLNRSGTNEWIHDINSYDDEPVLVGVERQGAQNVVSSDVKSEYKTPPYTRFVGRFNGSSASHDDDFAHSSALEIVKEMDENAQWRKSNRTIYPESKRTFHPKPPYVKPVATKCTQETAEKMSSDSRQSKQREDGSNYHIRRMNRTLSDQPRHRAYKEEGHHDEEMMDKLLIHYSKEGANNVPGKGRTRMRESPNETILDSSRRSELPLQDKRDQNVAKRAPSRADSVPPETTGQGEVAAAIMHTRSASMQPDQLSPRLGHVHPRLPVDYEDLAIRIAALRRP